MSSKTLAEQAQRAASKRTQSNDLLFKGTFWSFLAFLWLELRSALALKLIGRAATIVEIILLCRIYGIVDAAAISAAIAIDGIVSNLCSRLDEANRLRMRAATSIDDRRALQFTGTLACTGLSLLLSSSIVAACISSEALALSNHFLLALPLLIALRVTSQSLRVSNSLTALGIHHPIPPLLSRLLPSACAILLAPLAGPSAFTASFALLRIVSTAPPIVSAFPLLHRSFPRPPRFGSAGLRIFIRAAFLLLPAPLMSVGILIWAASHDPAILISYLILTNLVQLTLYAYSAAEKIPTRTLARFSNGDTWFLFQHLKKRWWASSVGLILFPLGILAISLHLFSDAILLMWPRLFELFIPILLLHTTRGYYYTRLALLLSDQARDFRLAPTVGLSLGSALLFGGWISTAVAPSIFDVALGEALFLGAMSLGLIGSSRSSELVRPGTKPEESYLAILRRPYRGVQQIEPILQTLRRELPPPAYVQEFLPGILRISFDRTTITPERLPVMYSSLISRVVTEPIDAIGLAELLTKERKWSRIPGELSSLIELLLRNQEPGRFLELKGTEAPFPLEWIEHVASRGGYTVVTPKTLPGMLPYLDTTTRDAILAHFRVTPTDKMPYLSLRRRHGLLIRLSGDSVAITPSKSSSCDEQALVHIATGLVNQALQNPLLSFRLLESP